MQPMLRSALVLLPMAIVASTLHAQDDGRRAVKVPRYGICVRVPQAWNLINWARDDQAFGLKLPQDAGSKSGFVVCRLGVAPDDLEDFQQRLAATPTDAAEKRTLLESRIEPIDPQRFGKALAEQLGRWLVTAWELETSAGDRVFELETRVIHDGTLYTFTLATDEAHWDAYRLDFEDMLASATFTAPETGLRKLPGGFWMQRDFRFALRLPTDWKPAFGPNDRVLFFATGQTHELFTDNLLVLASPARPLDLAHLKQAVPQQIAKTDAQARVECRIVPQGGAAALETVIRTTRGSMQVVIVERRFSSPHRNYEVKFTCEASSFEKLAPALQNCLDSFVEVPAEPPRVDA